MTADLHLSGPTVTVFGERDALDEALSAELGRRGCSTHSVTTPVGWLTSVSHAVIRLDTTTGEQAIRDLASRDAPASHVVIVCGTPTDAATTERLQDLCRQCGEHHDVSVIWHAPLEVRLDEARRVLPAELTPAPRDLAATIADEVGVQEAWTSAPSFVTQTFEPRRHRGHA
ncbi:hypothetical protein [Aeromicrobium stalagmiti]|uniref:hypothetical protein n=1 Tax=Aeromicrobium stalagmiti TaxID=2738988 RepID=UPI0015688633|nr:hypothetical protein [Aeromicrobium stalagmiti]NRQ49163.1 hypothetical protein [Aeromicrobium stalagmiti]